MVKLDIAEATKGLTKKEIRRSVTMTMERLFGTMLDSALWEYGSLGFRLERHGDELELYFKEIKIASYDSDTVTVETIHEDCKRFISRTTRGIIYHSPSHREG